MAYHYNESLVNEEVLDIAIKFIKKREYFLMESKNCKLFVKVRL